jgi:hypothetical protein
MASTDIYVDLVAYSLRDWEAIIPTVFTVGTTSSVSKSILTDVYTNSTTSGTFDISTQSSFDATFTWTGSDVDNEFSMASGTLNSTNDVDNDVILSSSGILNTSSLNTIDTIQLGAASFLKLEDVNVIYSSPEIDRFSINDTNNEFRIYIGTIKYTNDVYVEAEIAGIMDFPFIAEIFSTVSGVKDIDVDVELESGRVSSINCGLFSCVSGVSDVVNNDIWSTASGINYCFADIDVVSGTLSPFLSDINSSAMTSGTIACDVRTWSLTLSDFFLHLDEFTTASATAWVDITDKLYAVDTGNTYFLVDGQQVGVTFSGIQDGYRMFYDPPDDFYSRGSLVYITHAQNAAGDIIENTYSLLYGYDIDFTSLVDWGYNKTIAVWATATNLAHCLNTEADAFYFKTKDLWSKDLGASITPVGFADLRATLNTVGKHFYYGETYTITISGTKDFQGNEMETQIYTFTIEDPTI